MNVKNRRYNTIADFYRGRNVLITGATGFLGKILVWKLLTSCPEIGIIYMILRPKKGCEVKKRKEDYISCQVFDSLRKEYPDFAKHLVAVCGDVTQEGLGLSIDDSDLLRKNVSAIFHCAANVRFDMPLKDAILQNTFGTQQALNLGEKVENLEAFVYVSTAFCHCDVQTMEEKVYNSMHDPEHIIKIVQWLDKDVTVSMTSKLLGKMPNTYAYSKNLSEYLASTYSEKFPIAIARPSIVTASFKEPAPGWIDNINGPMGISIAAGKGVIRSMLCKENYYSDSIPVDITVNAILAVAWHLANTRPKSTYVCNITTSDDNRITWGEILNTGKKLAQEEVPFSTVMWYPDGSLKSSAFLHNLCVFFFHILPAYFIDFFILLIGKKPFMVKIQKRIQIGLKMLQYYTTRVWDFRNDNLHSLRDSLTEKERDTFFFDMKELHWPTYIKNTYLGAKVYLLKEDIEKIPEARRNLRRLYWLHQVVKTIFYIFLLWVLYTWSGWLLHVLDISLSSVTEFLHNVPIARVRADAPINDEITMRKD